MIIRLSSLNNNKMINRSKCSSNIFLNKLVKLNNYYYSNANVLNCNNRLFASLSNINNNRLFNDLKRTVKGRMNWNSKLIVKQYHSHNNILFTTVNKQNTDTDDTPKLKWWERIMNILIAFFRQKPKRLFWLGNIGYTFSLLGMIATDMLVFRCLLLSGQLIFTVFNIVIPAGPLWLNLKWNAVFITINLIQVALLLYDYKEITLPDEALALYGLGFKQHGITLVSFRQLLNIGEWVDIPAETLIATEGEKIDEVTFILRGNADVYSNGATHIGTCRAGDFIGEVNFLNEEKYGGATADVKSRTDVIAYQWNKKKLAAYLRKHPELQKKVISLMTDDLLQKMTNQHDTRSHNAALETYTELLGGILAGRYITAESKEYADNFRERYNISNDAHQKLLEHNYWTEKEWKKGKRYKVVNPSPLAADPIDLIEDYERCQNNQGNEEDCDEEDDDDISENESITIQNQG